MRRVGGFYSTQLLNLFQLSYSTVQYVLACTARFFVFSFFHFYLFRLLSHGGTEDKGALARVST